MKFTEQLPKYLVLTVFVGGIAVMGLRLMGPSEEFVRVALQVP